MIIDGFTSSQIVTDDTEIFVCAAGAGPPLLLLHGFPQTHLMWRRVAPLLVERFTVLCADLRGYGRSGCPASAPDHRPYSKRAMAEDMVLVMERFGFSRFSVAGHDRGGRVACRMALDHADRIERLAVLDVVPTETVWECADARFTLAFWPWSLLAQPAPLPERILMTTADTIVEHALREWGAPATVFPADVRAAYTAALRDSDHAHAICEEYRAAATIDRTDDQADVERNHRLGCPLLVLWSARGPLGSWYEQEGGPIALWRCWCDDVQGKGLPGGHFFPEEAPRETAETLIRFFNRASLGDSCDEASGTDILDGP